MSLLISLILGGLVGWLAARVAGRDEGAVASVAIGVLGSVIGSTLSYALGAGKQAYLAFSLSSLIWSFIGALLLVGILNAIQRRSRGHIGGI